MCPIVFIMLLVLVACLCMINKYIESGLLTKRQTGNEDVLRFRTTVALETITLCGLRSSVRPCPTGMDCDGKQYRPPRINEQ